MASVRPVALHSSGTRWEVCWEVGGFVGFGMTKKGLNWPQMAVNDLKWPKMTPKWPKVTSKRFANARSRVVVLFLIIQNFTSYYSNTYIIIRTTYVVQGDFFYMGHFAHTFFHRKRRSIFENDRLNWQGGLRNQFKTSNVNFRLTFDNLQLRRFFVEKFFTKSEKVLRDFFSFFFRESVYFQLKRRESEKKIHKKKFPLNLKNTWKIFGVGSFHTSDGNWRLMS